MTTKVAIPGSILRSPRRLATGQSLAEFIIVIPVLILLTLGILQFSLFFIAKSTLDQAAISGVRDGIVNGGDPCSMRAGIVKGMTPLYQPAGMSRDAVGYVEALVNAWKLTTPFGGDGLNAIKIDVLNPTDNSFKDFKTDVLQDGKTIKAIPNARLLYRNTKQGRTSGQSIQDANLLSIRVNYCYPVIVWPVRWVTKLLPGADAFGSACYTAGGIPIQATATMLMQSPATDTWVDKGLGAFCSDPFAGLKL